MNILRKIYITGEITDEAFHKFSRKLARLEGDNHATVYVELVSEGGDAYAALAFFDRIRHSACPIVITAFGYVASAATLILAGGDKRIMGPSSWVMVHEDSESEVSQERSVTRLEKDAAHYRRLEGQWCRLLASATKADEETWAKLHKEEMYLTAKECLDLGIIDEVLE